jgi:predicted nucleotidyltransferase
MCHWAKPSIKKYTQIKVACNYIHILYNIKHEEKFMDTIEKLQKNGIFLNYDNIVTICKKYHINELSIFGSSLRDDFNKNSDIDILVSFNKDSNITLFDIIELENEFTGLLNREVDIVEKESLKNPIRKNKILSTREIIYAA